MIFSLLGGFPPWFEKAGSHLEAQHSSHVVTFWSRAITAEEGYGRKKILNVIESGGGALATPAGEQGRGLSRWFQDSEGNCPESCIHLPLFLTALDYSSVKLLIYK